MAIHQKCPVLDSRDSSLIIGTELITCRCKANICKGKGETPSSLHYYCVGCSVHYKICEKCGQLLSDDRPAQAE